MGNSKVISASGIGGALVAFLLTANTLLPIPLDKILMALLVVVICWMAPENRKQPAENYVLYLSVCLVCLLSAGVNLVIKPIPLFPMIALAFVFLSLRNETLIDAFYKALTIHILLGLVFLGVSYINEDIPFYNSLRAKGIPFIHTPLGFVTTVQVFGTLCIIWLIIYFEKKKDPTLKKPSRFLYGVVTLAVILTFNRSTYLFYFILLAFKDRKLLYVYLLLLALAVLLLIRAGLEGIFFNTQTLTSRSELLEGFNLSFWREGSLMTYIFGKGDNFLTADVLNRVKWDYREDIENGYAMLLHTYGFLGLTVFILSGTVFVLKLVMEQRWYLAVVVSYYFFVSSFFTQEFVVTSFYIFTLVVLIIRKNTPSGRYQYI